MKTEKIWSEFSEALKKFILSKVKDEAIAEDVLQEVFIKIHLHKDTLQKEDRLKSWLFQIANNTTNDYFRKQKIKTVDQNYKEPSETHKKNGHEAKDCLLPLILNLPKKYKEALLLTEINGLKQAEAAEKLKISLPAAKSRIQRGRELLKQGFMDCCDYKIDENGFLKGEHKDSDECKVCT
jgi:RNA polymerase sigma-70 factor (ECF subfamily)